MTPDEKNEEDKKRDARIKALSGLLNRLPAVREHDEDKETQASIMAHGLTDIAEEADEICYLVDILKSPNMTDVRRLEVLNEIGEALRHLDYHVHDMAFYDAYVDEEIEN